MLTAIHGQLLLLDASEQDGTLLSELTLALMRAYKHSYLLNLLHFQPDATQLSSSAATPHPCILRPGNEGYLNLEEAKVAALKAPARPAGDPLEVEGRRELGEALRIAQQSLAKLGDTPCQALIELYARLKGLACEGSDITAVASPSQKSTAKVGELLRCET